MPNNNGYRTTTDWLIHIDGKLTAIDSKLDTKTDKHDHERLEDRVMTVENRVQHQEIKTAGIAGSVSVVAVWLKNHLFGG